MASSVKQWEQYYRSGGFATGPVGLDGNYDLEVKALWEHFFCGLDKSAKLLDVGTGNGVIAGIAREVSQRDHLSYEIHGTDLALIQPMQDVRNASSRLQGVQFHPGVATEALPMPNESFDAVSGHYALEYCDTEAALREVYRVLRPGGRALFVVHHAQSVLVKNALRTIQDGNFILLEAKLYAALRDLILYQGDSREVALKLLEPLQLGIRKVKAMFQKNHGRHGQMAQIALDATQKLLQLHGKIPSTLVLAEVDRAGQEFTDALDRVHDLVKVACSDERVQGLQVEALAAGFVVQKPAPLHHDRENLVGWVLGFSKPAGLESSTK